MLPAVYGMPQFLLKVQIGVIIKNKTKQNIADLIVESCFTFSLFSY